MTPDIAIVFSILGFTIGLFIWDKWRMDMVAIAALLSLGLFGILTPSELVAGFGQPVVVMIAALFVIGEGLFRTGVASSVGQGIVRLGGTGEIRLLVLLMVCVAFLSAFMSSTGAVAIFIPVVMAVARRAGLPASRFMMPLAFASLVGGMLTLIGTPPNLVVSEALRDFTGEGFGFFSFAPIGLVILCVVILYMTTLGRKQLISMDAKTGEGSEVSLETLVEDYQVGDSIHTARVEFSSPLVGQCVAEAKLRSEFEITVFGIKRKGRLVTQYMQALSETKIYAGDELLIIGEQDNIDRLCGYKKLTLLKDYPSVQDKLGPEYGTAEVMLRPGSSLAGLSLKKARLRDRFYLNVIGIRRGNELIQTRFRTTPLEAGDTLLLCGGWNAIRRLNRQNEFLVLNTPIESVSASYRSEKAPVAIGILLLMLALMLTGALPVLTSILIAALLMVMTGCVRSNEVYASLSAPSLVLIACMLPMAVAMEKTGALSLTVDALRSILSDAPPILVCVVLFLVTSLFSQVISNTATTVLIAPVALLLSQNMSLNPEPLLMAVAIGASTAFATPVASPVNMLVLAPGGYRFMDFIKVGIPLILLVLAIVIIFVPILFPF